MPLAFLAHMSGLSDLASLTGLIVPFGFVRLSWLRLRFHFGFFRLHWRPLASFGFLGFLLLSWFMLCFLASFASLGFLGLCWCPLDFFWFPWRPLAYVGFLARR